MTAPGLEVRGLSAAYGARPVLRDLGFEVAPGEVLAVIGPNGCGKSTLLRVLAGLVPPAAGEIRWAGDPLPQIARNRARIISLMPQHFSGGADLTVEAMAELGRTPYLGPYGAPSSADRAAVEAAVELTAPDLRGRQLGELSGGERQRALLARVYAGETPVVLLDEPVASLDIRHQYQILDIVRRQSRERHQSVICVLHGINLAAAFADKMLFMNEGQIVSQGSPETVMTAANLTNVYGLDVRVAPHPISGRPQAQAMWDFAD